MSSSTLRIRVPALGPAPAPITDPGQRGIRLGRLLWRPLVDDSSSVISPLAREVDVAPIGDRIELSLDPSARWSDGTRLVADDIVSAAVSTLPPTVDVWSARGRITFAGPDAVRAASRVIPTRCDGDRIDPTVTSGPYALDELSDTRAKLIRTAHDPRLPDNVEFVAVTDPEVALASLKSAELDVMLESDESTVADVIASSELAAVAVPDSTSLVQVLGFNLGSDRVADRHVRHLLAYAVDRPALAHEIYLGLARHSPAPVTPSRNGPLDDEFSILVNAENRLRVAAGKRIVADWASAGVRGRLEIEPWSSFVERLRFGDFETFLLSVRQDTSALWPSASGPGVLGALTRCSSTVDSDHLDLEKSLPASNLTVHTTWMVLDPRAIRHIPLVVAAAGGGIAC